MEKSIIEILEEMKALSDEIKTFYGVENEQESD
jgi:hypothetical protein